ncbi:MAG: HAD family hydrolase [Gemmatimonadales bacterium]|nr:HAD family hydrolase [Gemmatimonadales bacterium]
MNGARRPAAFLDRDGTIIADVGYPANPDQVTLLPGAREALVALAEAGYLLVVVTNQSGIARGLISWAQYRAVAERMEALLRPDVTLAATYVCPHHPDIDGACSCRKPGLAHYLDAVIRLDLDAGRSIWVGDRVTDVEPAAHWNGRGYLIQPGNAAPVEPLPPGTILVQDLAEAATRALS